MAEEITGKKQFTFKGMNAEQLKQIEVREFAKYLRSDERRFVLRNFQEIEKFISKCREKISKKKQVKTHTRDIVIVPQMIGMKIQIYNGKMFVPVDITGEMLGHKLGEFAPTRGRVKHTKAGVGATKGTKSKSKK